MGFQSGRYTDLLIVIKGQIGFSVNMKLILLSVLVALVAGSDSFKIREREMTAAQWETACMQYFMIMMIMTMTMMMMMMIMITMMETIILRAIMMKMKGIMKRMIMMMKIMTRVVKMRIIMMELIMMMKIVR